MELRQYCEFLSRLLRVGVLAGDEEEALARFCENARFHSLQDHLYPEVLGILLRSTEEAEIASLNDAFQIRIVFTRIGGESVLLGPFCCEDLSTADAHILLERAGLPIENAKALLAYRGRFPVLSEREAFRALHTLMYQTLGTENTGEVRRINFTMPPSVPEGTEAVQPYALQVAERYAVELEMMRFVEQGNAAGALTNWRKLHQPMGYLVKQVGYTLENSRMSAAITRTVIRVGAMRAGVPSQIIDALTHQASMSNFKARSIDEIQSNTEKLIRAICRESKRIVSDGESYLSASVKFYLRAHLSEDVSIAGLAAYLGLPESRLIEQFRVENGVTPGAFLRALRMKKAAELLRSTRWPVQRVAAEVGVPDANYFIKLFRAAFGVTPGAYRRNRDAVGHTA